MFSAEVVSSPAADGSKATNEHDVRDNFRGSLSYTADQPVRDPGIDLPRPESGRGRDRHLQAAGPRDEPMAEPEDLPLVACASIDACFGASARYGTCLGSFFVALVGEEEIS